MNAKRFLPFILMILIVLNCGCMSRNVYQRQYYIIQPPVGSVKSQVMFNDIVEIGRFEIDQSFGSRNLVYCYGKNRFETDFYNAFMSSPDVLIAEQTRKWLNDSMLFKAVIPYSVITQPRYYLRGYIEKLYGDYSDKSLPKAVMEIRYYLLDAAKEVDIIFSRLYTAEFGISMNSPAAMVEGFGKCLERILTELTDDLSKLELHKAEKKPAKNLGNQ